MTMRMAACGLLCAVVATAAVAQDDRGPAMGEGPGGQFGASSRGERDFGPPSGRGMSSPGDVIKDFIANPAVVAAVKLTPAQVAAARSLDSATAKTALAASFLSNLLASVMADADVVAKLGLTPEQVTALRTTVTPALIKRALTAQQIDELMRSILAPGMGRMGQGGAVPGGAMSDRVREFDKDGDGQISASERAAAREAMGRRSDRSPREGEPAMPPPEDMMKFDKDGDGKLSAEEKAAARDALR